MLNIARDGVRIDTIGVQNFATTHLLAKKKIFKIKIKKGPVLTVDSEKKVAGRDNE